MYFTRRNLLLQGYNTCRKYQLYIYYISVQGKFTSSDYFIICTCRFFISTSLINDFANVSALASLFKKSDTNSDAGLPPPCAKHSFR